MVRYYYVLKGLMLVYGIEVSSKGEFRNWFKENKDNLYRVCVEDKDSNCIWCYNYRGWESGNNWCKLKNYKLFEEFWNNRGDIFYCSDGKMRMF